MVENCFIIIIIRHHLDPLALQLVNSGESRCWRLKVDKAIALQYAIIVIAT